MSFEDIKIATRNLCLSYDKVKNTLNTKCLRSVEELIVNNETSITKFAEYLIKVCRKKNYTFRLSSIVVADYFIRKYDIFALYYLSWSYCFLDKIVFFNLPNDDESDKDDYKLMKELSRSIVEKWIRDLGTKFIKLQTIGEFFVKEDEKQELIEIENDKKLMSIFLKHCELAQKHYEELSSEMDVIFKRIDELMEELIPNELKNFQMPSSEVGSGSTSDINLSKVHGYDIDTEVQVFLRKDCFKVTITDENRGIFNELNKLHKRSCEIAKSLTRKIERLCESGNKFEKAFCDKCFNLREKIRRYIQKCNDIGVDRFYKDDVENADVKSDNDSDFEDVDIDDTDYLIPSKVTKQTKEDTIHVNIKIENLDKLKFNPYIKLNADSNSLKKEKPKTTENVEKNILSKFAALKKRK
uniref:VHS domain-containing protein n=1 Tax=Strongyloides venezuelensis TaxID=75913 RepID=A0A0K0FA66_STRVS